jgi:hypothetical protein
MGGWLSRLVARIRQDWRDLKTLLRGEQEPEMTLAEMLRATLPHVPESKIDWFVWECEQYAKSPVFWFDPWRYAGTDLAFDEPTEQQRRKVWEASLQRAIARHGQVIVRRHGVELADAIVGTPREDEYFRQPDPWAWAMNEAVH